MKSKRETSLVPYRSGRSRRESSPYRYSLAHQMDSWYGGTRSFIEYARWSRDPRVKALVKLCDLHLSRHASLDPKDVQRFMDSQEIEMPELIGAVVTACLRAKISEGDHLCALSYTRVVETNIAQALKASGAKDREMFLRKMGWPLGGSPSLNVTAVASSSALPSFPATMASVDRAVREED